ncbi:hypothetical protein BKL50_10870 [Rodentibacter pneumotropicus]|nr:hypothetical protein BKL50_10870 [Rodentibacter pneumotropicus]
MWGVLRPILKDVYPVSRLVLLLQFLTIVVPFLTLIAQENRNFVEIYYICVPFVLIIYSIRILPNIYFPLMGKHISSIITVCFIAIGIYVFLGLIITGGLNRMNFNLYSVYEVRAELKEAGFPLSGYLVPWFAYVINILLLVYGIGKKNKLYITTAIILQILLFGMTNFKAFITVPIIVLGLLFLLNRMKFIVSVLLGSIFLVLLLLTISLFGELMGISLLRRILNVPAGMHSLYFDYFSTNPIALMSGTKWADVFGGTYEDRAVIIIAKEFWGREFSPNVGWVGDAFANFGLKGIAIMSIGLVLILKLGDSLAKNVSIKGSVECLFIGMAIALGSSGLNTVVLTHGAWLAIVGAWWLSWNLRTSS